MGKVARARHAASCELLGAAHIEHERCGRRSARGEPRRQGFGAHLRQGTGRRHGGRRHGGRRLRHLHQFREVVTHVRDLLDERGVALIVDRGRTGHDPDIVARAARDDGLGVAGIHMRDHILGLDGPDELHAPDGVMGAGDHETLRVHDLRLAVEGALVEGEGGLDGAVRREFVGLDRVVDVLLDEGRDDADDIPRPHEALQVDLLDHGHGDLLGRDAAGTERGGEGDHQQRGERSARTTADREADFLGHIGLLSWMGVFSRTSHGAHRSPWRPSSGRRCRHSAMYQRRSIRSST